MNAVGTINPFRQTEFYVEKGGVLEFLQLSQSNIGFVTYNVTGVGSEIAMPMATSISNGTFALADQAKLTAPLLQGIGSLDSNSTFAPNTGNQVVIAGAMVQNTTGRLILNANLPLTQSMVQVGGAATLAGVLEVKFISTPAVGTTFDAIAYASLTGTFSSIVATGLPAGFLLEPSYGAKKLTLTVRQGSGEGPDSSPSPVTAKASSVLYGPELPKRSELDSSLASGEGSDPIVLVRQFLYDAAFSQLTKSTEENGHITLFEVDPANGNRLSKREVVGPIDDQTNNQKDDVVTRYTYTVRGQLDTMTDPLGRVTDIDYDLFGRVTRMTRAKGTADQAITQYEYNAAGNMTVMIDANGNRTEYQFDLMNRPIKTTEADPDGAGPLTSPITLFSYDKDGNLVELTDALQHKTANRYDARRRLIETVGPDPDGTGPLAAPMTKFSYDAAGNTTNITDPLNKQTQYRYDARNRRIESIDPEGGRTRFGYDFDNNMVKLTDPVGNVTQFAFDARDRQTQETDPLGKAIRYAYDGANNLTEKVDRNARMTQFSYDDRDRLTKENWVGGSNTINYTYDSADNMLSARDSFSALTFSYDSLDRVKTTDNVGTPNFPRVALSYSYDAVGNVTSVTDAINGQHAATNVNDFDALNRVKRISQSGTTVQTKRVDYDYNSLGQTTALKRFSDLTNMQSIVTTTYAFDQQNRLSLIDHKSDSGTAYASFGFGYDSASRITQIAEKNQTIDYGYDVRDQLTSANYSAATRTDETFKFDANGNRVQSNAHGTGYKTGPGNRLLSDGVYNYVYDNEGNLTKRAEIASGNVREFQWDHRNRLMSVSEKNAVGVLQQVVRYTYDAFGRRIAKSVDTTPLDAVDAALEQYVYDGDDVILDFVDPDGSGPAASQQTVRYLRGPGIDNLLAIEKAQQTSWVLQDHLGSTRAIVSSQGVLLQSIDYDAFGKAIVDSAPLTRYQFTGREAEQETGLYYYRARYYDPGTGRFIGEDPIGFEGGSWNIYTYVSNSPIRFSDWSGLGVVDCLKAQLELTAAQVKLANRIRERQEGIERGEINDPGHDKSIEQAKNRVRKAEEKVAKHCNSCS